MFAQTAAGAAARGQVSNFMWHLTLNKTSTSFDEDGLEIKICRSIDHRITARISWSCEELSWRRATDGEEEKVCSELPRMTCPTKSWSQRSPETLWYSGSCTSQTSSRRRCLVSWEHTHQTEAAREATDTPNYALSNAPQKLMLDTTSRPPPPSKK